MALSVSSRVCTTNITTTSPMEDVDWLKREGALQGTAEVCQTWIDSRLHDIIVSASRSSTKGMVDYSRLYCLVSSGSSSYDQHYQRRCDRRRLKTQT